MYTYTKNDYAILRAIRNAKSELISITIKSLQEETKLSTVKIRKTLKLFLNEGYVKQGIPKIKAKTFYITQEGINKLKEVMGG